MRCVYNAADGQESYAGTYSYNTTLKDGMYYVHPDHLGSFVTITDGTGAIKQKCTFDAWGNRVFVQKDNTLIFDRGYTGHEHLPEFGLINMNARMYDPVIGRFLSPDPYVQMPDFSQSFNRYSFCLNNPLIYTDPDGENPLLIAAGIYSLFFKNTGYEIQKYVSPVAFKVNVHWTNEYKGLGYDVSIGVPKSLPVSYRQHWGETKYWSHYDNSFIGTEKRKGAEWTFGGVVNYSGTTFTSGETSQTTNMITIGTPGLNVQYENDYMFGLRLPGVPQADGGDRYRTAAAKINYGIFSLGLNVFTGDPGLDPDDRRREIINGKRTYVENQYGDDPDKYRAGIFYVGVGPFRFGRNSEQIRHVFQNRFAHDILMGGKSPYFLVLDYRKQRWFWGFTTGTGNSLW